MKRMLHKGMQVALLGALTLACNQREKAEQRKNPKLAPPMQSSPKAGQVVAQIGDQKITEQAIATELEALPSTVQARFASLERRKALLEALVDLEVLERQARKEGLHNEAAFVNEQRRTLAALALDHIGREKVRFDTITDAQVRRYYEEHPDRYKDEPYTQAKSAIRNELYRLRKKAATDAYVAKLRARASIVINKDNHQF